VPRDLDLCPFDPKINQLPGLTVEHLYNEFGDTSCIGFWDVVWIIKQTNKQTNKLINAAVHTIAVGEGNCGDYWGIPYVLVNLSISGIQGPVDRRVKISDRKLGEGGIFVTFTVILWAVWVRFSGRSVRSGDLSAVRVDTPAVSGTGVVLQRDIVALLVALWDVNTAWLSLPRRGRRSPTRRLLVGNWPEFTQPPSSL